MVEQHRCVDCANWGPCYDLFHDSCKAISDRRFTRNEAYALHPCVSFRWNPENGLTELESRVLEALKRYCRGQHSASPSSELGKLAGLSDRDGRATREIISALRRKGEVHGVLIASGPNGFYLPKDEDESLRCLQTLQSREEEATETRFSYEKLHKELFGNGRRSA